MRTTFQALHTLNGQQIGSDARDFGTHPVQHPAQLLYIRFTGRIVNRGDSFGQHCRHNNIGRTCDRCLIQQHIRTFQLVSSNTKTTFRCIVIKRSTQFLNTQEMGIQTPATNLVTSRLGNHCFPKTGNQRTDQHDRATQFGAASQELIAFQVSQIQVIRLKRERITSCFCYFYAHITEQLYQVIDIQNIRNVSDNHFLVCQQRSTKHLQHFVLSPLRHNLPLQFVPSFDYK